MKLIIKLLGILFILIGISFIIYPDGVYTWIEDSGGNIMLYISVIVTRLVLGIALIIAAKKSKYPVVIKIFGYVAIAAALVVIIIGHNGFQVFISSLISFKPYAPLSGLISIAVGSFLIYAFSRNKELGKVIK